MSKLLSKFSTNQLNNPQKYEMRNNSGSFNNFNDNTTTDLKSKNTKIFTGRISRFNTAYEQNNTKRLSKCRRKSLIGLTIMDMKNIEEEIKNKILQMKYFIQIEMKQIYGDTLLEKFLKSSTVNKENTEISANKNENKSEKS